MKPNSFRSSMLLCLCAPVLLFSACASLAKTFTSAATEAGLMDQERADSINKTASAADDISADMKKALDEITPEQEYYIGRALSLIHI